MATVIGTATYTTVAPKAALDSCPEESRRKAATIDVASSGRDVPAAMSPPRWARMGGTLTSLARRWYRRTRCGVL
jgi:hypothetical protein